MCWDSINVCCRPSMAKHLTNLCSSQQTQSRIASMWSPSIFHYMGQIHLTVSPCHRCSPFLSESHICYISQGACFPVFLRSEAITFCSSLHAVNQTKCWAFHTECVLVTLMHLFLLFFFIKILFELHFELFPFLYSLIQLLKCTAKWTVIGFVINDKADRKLSYGE